MKYFSSILSLSILAATLFYTQHVFSQSILFDYEQPSFDFNQFINPNTGLPTGVEEQITIQQIPRIPSPGETVSITLSGYSTNLNKATITWTLNGNILNSGVGATQIQFQAP